MGKGKPWTREDVIIAYALYCVIPFSKVNNSNQTIKDAAAIMDRSPASLKMRICNLAALDPDFLATGRAGLSGVAKLDQEVFAEFSNDWAEISDKQARRFFRKSVIAAYEGRCCISGMTIPQMLIASHIKPYAVSDLQTERANPANGLLLNAFYDRAFDQGLMTVLPDLTIIISDQVKEVYTDERTREWLYAIEGTKIKRPARFAPKRDLLEYHNEYVFLR